MAALDLSRAKWRKSTRSNQQGGACVEVAVVWRKSTRSQPQGQNCVEIAALADIVAIRDSKNPDGPKLILGQDEWQRFAVQIKRGSYNFA